MTSPKKSNLWSEKQGTELVQRWRASGLSQAEFGRTQGIEPHRISYWRRRLERKTEAPAFVLLSGEPSREATADSSGGVLEVWLGETIRLKIPFEQGSLGATVALLKEALS